MSVDCKSTTHRETPQVRLLPLRPSRRRPMEGHGGTQPPRGMTPRNAGSNPDGGTLFRSTVVLGKNRRWPAPRGPSETQVRVLAAEPHSTVSRMVRQRAVNPPGKPNCRFESCPWSHFAQMGFGATRVLYPKGKLVQRQNSERRWRFDSVTSPKSFSDSRRRPRQSGRLWN